MPNIRTEGLKSSVMLRVFRLRDSLVGGSWTVPDRAVPGPQPLLHPHGPPFEANLKKRLAKSPKIYVRDRGLLHALLGWGPSRTCSVMVSALPSSGFRFAPPTTSDRAITRGNAASKLAIPFGRQLHLDANHARRRVGPAGMRLDGNVWPGPSSGIPPWSEGASMPIRNDTRMY